MSQTKSGVAKATFDGWKLALDAENEWIEAEFVNSTTGVFVKRITCRLCTKHVNKINGVRSFSEAFIRGIEGSCLKKDNLKKHEATDYHKKAQQLEKGPMTINAIYKKTPIGEIYVKIFKLF